MKVKIFPPARSLKNLTINSYSLRGAKPVKPAMTGVDTDRVFTLRTVEDTLRIHKFIAENDVKSAVIAGGGYIGLEMAENLTEKGIRVTIVQRPNQVMAPLDYDMSCQLHGLLRKKGHNLKNSEAPSQALKKRTALSLPP